MQFYLQFQEDTEKDYVKNAALLPNSAQWFNSYVEGSLMFKIADIFPLTFLPLVNGGKN